VLAVEREPVSSKLPANRENIREFSQIPRNPPLKTALDTSALSALSHYSLIGKTGKFQW
jgi:hypothetical protein